MQVVLLAAGLGSRLGSLTKDIPKALIEVADKPLVVHALEFAARLRPEKAIVVGGYGHALVSQRLEQARTSPALAGLPIELLENPHFRDGNLVSLMTARPRITQGFLLLNVDHIYRPGIAQVVAPEAHEVTAFIDTDRQLGADDMKVERTAEGRIRRIAKALTTFDCGYVGMTACRRRRCPATGEPPRPPWPKRGAPSTSSASWPAWPRARPPPCAETSAATAGWRSTPPTSAPRPRRPCRHAPSENVGTAGRGKGRRAAIPHRKGSGRSGLAPAAWAP